MLSEPLAFSYAGWGCGTLLLMFYGLLTCYTYVSLAPHEIFWLIETGLSAKILARFIIADPAVRTYADIGRKAFGKRSTNFISILFCLELFTVTVALVTLYGDSLRGFLLSRVT
jgi:solute carrier family 32 (vesicular inhibitory amino acid transporter)